MTKNAIICPNCGAEYNPGEIFLPRHFLGQPIEVLKDSNGKIKSVIEGTKQDLEETYICDMCESEFKVSAKIEYETELLFKKRKTDYIQQL